MSADTYNERAAAIIRSVIHEWDPYCLLRSGAPEDEFDDEIALVLAEIHRIRSQSDAITLVSVVFSRAFGPEEFGRDACAQVGSQLYNGLKSAGLLPID